MACSASGVTKSGMFRRFLLMRLYIISRSAALLLYDSWPSPRENGYLPTSIT